MRSGAATFQLVDERRERGAGHNGSVVVIQTSRRARTVRENTLLFIRRLSRTRSFTNSTCWLEPRDRTARRYADRSGGVLGVGGGHDAGRTARPISDDPPRPFEVPRVVCRP